MDNDNNKVRRITLPDLWDLLLQHFWVILLVAILSVLLVGGYFTFIVSPEYQSTATLYILRRDNESDYVYTQYDFSLAKDVVNDCTYVLKSQGVLEDVIDRLKLECSVSSLKKTITTNNPENTRFLEITVTSSSPESAKQIVDCLCDIGSDKIIESMGFNQVNRYSYGQIPTTSCNKPGLTTYVILALLVGIITYFIYAVRYFLDTNLRSEEDIARYLGISVLAEIPNFETGRTHSGGQSRYYQNSKYRYTSSQRAASNRKGDKK